MSATQSPDELEMILGKVYSSDSLGDEFNEYEKHELKTALLAWRDAHTREAVLNFATKLFTTKTEGLFDNGDLFIKRKPLEQVVIDELGYETFKAIQEAAGIVDLSLKPADDKETKQ